jgi:hypothetical protein
MLGCEHFELLMVRTLFILLEIKIESLTFHLGPDEVHMQQIAKLELRRHIKTHEKLNTQAVHGKVASRHKL